MNSTALLLTVIAAMIALALMIEQQAFVEYLRSLIAEDDPPMFDDPLHDLIFEETEPPVNVTPMLPSPFLEVTRPDHAEYVRGFDPDSFLAEIIPDALQSLLEISGTLEAA